MTGLTVDTAVTSAFVISNSRVVLWKNLWMIRLGWKAWGNETVLFVVFARS